MRRRPRAALAASAAFAVALGAGSAAAEPYVIASPEALVVFAGDPYLGVGGAVTGGWGLDLEPLLVAPELSLSAHVIPAAGTASLLRATVGARVGLTAFVEPSVYARVGAGMTDAEGAPAATGGVALDAGAALDVRPSRDLTFGGHLGYAGLATTGGGDGLHGIAIGARVGLWF